MTRGRLEAQIYQASNWTANAVGTATNTATVTASSTRFPTDLLTVFGTALSTATTDTVTVTGSFGEAGTGLVTISSTANIAITWTSTDLRDLLGFTGNLSAATSHVGTKQCRGVWLPNCEIVSAYGNDDEGHTETDQGSTESPRGDIKTLSYNTRQVLPSVRWSHVPKAQARISAETTTGASFEQWWRWTQGGELTYFEVGSAINLYWDAATSTKKTYRCSSRKGTQMDRTVAEWNGLYDIALERLVRVPGT